MKKVAAGLALSLVLLTGCGEETMNDAGSALPTVTTNKGEAPTIGAPTGDAPTEMVISDIIVGTGAQALATSTMTVHYTLMTWSNGQLIES